ncbi:MAG: carboxypeptidase-like regulatory domain-containing protein [Bryobacteraceae bacterium]
MSDDEPRGGPEFWTEQAAEDRKDLRGQVIRWLLGFVLLFGGVFYAFWWSGEAVDFGAARVTGSASATYKLSGRVRDRTSGEPVRWAEVVTDPSEQVPLFRAETDQNGRFELMTLPAPHSIRINANGYQPATIRIGREWFRWLPKGSESVEIRMVPQ